jgi:hypothetical protein
MSTSRILVLPCVAGRYEHAIPNIAARLGLFPDLGTAARVKFGAPTDRFRNYSDAIVQNAVTTCNQSPPT